MDKTLRDNFYSLPADLPRPSDDGACDHLEGMSLPRIKLGSTENRILDLVDLTSNRTILFFYPRTGRPDEQAPLGWDEIPGARGCTPQSCGYRDHFSEFKELGYQVLGISTQTTEFQQELIQRIHLPFPILSDSEFVLTDTLNLPTFEFGGMKLLKRMAWVCEDGKILKVFYPVFPPDKNAETVIAWLKDQV